MPHEFLDHTADVKFVVTAACLEDAFSEAALATFDIITDVEKVEGKVEKKIHVKAPRKRTLLYEFLNELVYLVDTEGWLMHKVISLTISENDGEFSLDAVLSGDSGDYEILTQIKSVTYSDMEIIEGDDGVSLTVVHDI